MNKTLRKIVAFACAGLMLLSVGCGKDTENDTVLTDGTTILTSGVSDHADSEKAETNIDETVTTELFTTPVALEPEDLGANIADSVPAEYMTTLIEYNAMVQALVNDDIVDNGDGTYSSPYHPYPMISYSLEQINSKLENPTFSMFGYAVRDINGDEIPELILMCDNQALIEIYTIFNGEVKLATFFWPGFNGVITEDDKLYTETLNSSIMLDIYAIEILGTDTGYFSALKTLGRSIVDDPDDVFYVELKGDEEYSIDKETFDSFVADFPEIPKFGETATATSSIFEFIPIAIDG